MISQFPRMASEKIFGRLVLPVPYMPWRIDNRLAPRPATKVAMSSSV